MKKNAIYAVVAVIIIIIIIVIAAFALNLFGIPGTTNPTTTPAPSGTPAPNVGNAANLTFTAAITSQGTTTDYNWAGLNIHSDGPMIRVDAGNYAYIMDASQQKSWDSIDSGATWTTGNFTADWIAWSPMWTSYVDNLTHWSGSGNYSYTNPTGESIVLSNIKVDQPIPASTFSHP